MTKPTKLVAVRRSAGTARPAGSASRTLLELANSDLPHHTVAQGTGIPAALTATGDTQVPPEPPRLELVAEDDADEPAIHLALPDARAWGSRLVQAVTEVLAGDRPLHQLVRWTDPAVYMELYRRVRMLGLMTTASARGAKERCAIRSIHVSSPTDNVAELAAHVRYGLRSRAIALRLEVHRGRWICTALELGDPRHR
jgi:Family of unknown function (DUF6459)